MEKQKSTGISDIAIYIPELKIDIDKIINTRNDLTPRMSSKMRGAVKLTEQKSIRFPYPWEDPVTFAAESVKKIIQASGKDRLIRYIGTGTETGLDFSKPLAAYVQGLLAKGGMKLPINLSTYQTQHACASGTLSMLNIASLLLVCGKGREAGLAVCSDIAHYERNSTAEITQGAGSVTLLIEKDPKLIEIDLQNIGYASSDVDDFFRPLNSKTAKVKGQYSMKCYQDSLIEAFDDFLRRIGRSAEDILNTTDYFVCHSPFAAMPKMALRYLLEEKLGLDYSAADSFTMSHVVDSASEYVSSIGNLYSGAMYLSLAALLKKEYRRISGELTGRKILFASYGSGNTMIIFRGTIAERAPEQIEKWDFDRDIGLSKNASLEEYENWIHEPFPIHPGKRVASKADVPSGRFFLRSVREDGYHEYGFSG